MTEPGIVVFAYHDVGVECLDALIRRGSRVLAVFTHRDNPEERIWFRSVAELAQRHKIPVYTPDSVNTPEWIARLRETRPDIIFSFYYRNLICQEILDIPRLGAFNLHGSLLPKYRGRVPINWAVLNGETQTGASLHHMVRRPDAGDIVDQEAVPIGPRDSARDVFVKVTAAARKILERSMDAIKQGRAPRRTQDESRASYFGGRGPEDGRIDWRADIQRIFNLIRAVTHPYPGAFTDVDGRRLFIWWAEPRSDCSGMPGEVVSVTPLRVAAGAGCIEIRQWQWRGGLEQSGAAHGLRLNQILGQAAPRAASV
ncbi:MAG: formyltransferase [Gammaproteobacteria bacterium]|nr:formyltransferase [Gammaproteobacteria bacterium]